MNAKILIKTWSNSYHHAFNDFLQMHDRLSIIACQKLKVKQKLATWIQWVTVCINLCQLMLWAWVFWPNGVYRRPGNHKLLFTKYRKWIWRAAYIIVRYCIEIALEGTRLLGLHQQKTNSAGKFISWMTGWSYVRSQLFLIRYHCEEAWERQKKTLCGNRK